MINPYTEILDILDNGERWTKLTLSHSGSYCIRGAMRESPEWEWHYSDWDWETTLCAPIAEVIVERYPERAKWPPSPISAVIDFNDDERTDWLDVKLVLKDTAARWDEAHTP